MNLGFFIFRFLININLIFFSLFSNCFKAQKLKRPAAAAESEAEFGVNPTMGIAKSFLQEDMRTKMLNEVLEDKFPNDFSSKKFGDLPAKDKLNVMVRKIIKIYF